MSVQSLRDAYIEELRKTGKAAWPELQVRLEAAGVVKKRGTAKSALERALVRLGVKRKKP